MRTLINESLNPAFNLALEEYLLKEYQLDEDLFYVWRNAPSVVIGRNQNPYNEVNLPFCHKQNIPIYRRISGGGTVFHDEGNVNFTFIKNNLKLVSDYQEFLTPIITLLNQMGLQARFHPKSHIYLHKQKISGNAQATHKNRVLHHGTILYDIDLERASRCLKTKDIKGHYVQSVPASIVNIKEKIPVITNITSFMNFIRDGVLMQPSLNRSIVLQESDYKRVHQIQTTKYQSFNWNFGMNTSFIINNDYVRLEVKEGIVVKSSVPELQGLQVTYQSVEQALKLHEQKQEILKSIF